MSYIVEQKINGRIYLYQVESFWDKERKQARQKRKYIGPKERIYKVSEPRSEAKEIVRAKPSHFVSK